MFLFRITIFLLLLAVPAHADQRADLRTKLFEALRSARSETTGRAAENRIWRFWMTGPNDEATALLARAMERRRWYDFAAALEILDKTVMIAPDWAEAWNQRAFIHFLRGSYDKSLDDLARALELEPMHFAALSGIARIHMRQGRMKLGQSALRRAIKIHPFLKERSMLIEPADKDL